MMTLRGRCLPLLAGAVFLAAQSARAVHVQTWTHQTQHDFESGQFDNVVVDSYGEMTLGRAVTRIGATEKADFVNCLTQGKDGAVFFGTSGHGAVYKIADGKASLFYKAPEAQDQVLSMAADGNGGILAATCGKGSKIVRLTASTDGKTSAATVFENSAVDYIWAIAPAADGTLYLGTGPKGQVWKVPAGKPTEASVVLETGGRNVCALVLDGKGNLFAGTDNRGLVIKMDLMSAKPFVVMDAGEVDVTALAAGDDGDVFVATASPDASGRGPASEGAKPARPGKVEPDVPEPPDDQTPPAAKTPGRPVGALPRVAPVQASAPVIYAASFPGIFPLSLAAASGDSPKLPSTARKPASLHGGPRPAPDEPEEPANAVYRITSDGAVTSLMDEDDAMLALAYHDGELFIGTGGQGKLYVFHPETQSQALVARVGNENVMSLLRGSDGTVYFGTSNSGQVYAMGAKPATKGTFTSDVLDAKYPATWGTGSLMASVPPGAKATLAVRTGNVRDVERQGKFWSDWSAEMAFDDAEKLTRITAPAGRFLQYRVTLTADGSGKTPAVEQVRIAYQVQNLPPKIKELTVDSGTPAPDADDSDSGPPKPPGPTPHDENEKATKISWDASDPNKDELTFRVYYRPAGTPDWILLAKDVKDTDYSWNTRAVPDGKYQVKVEASDAADNSEDQAKAVARVTGTFLVVNTPPAVSELKAAAEANRARVTGTASAKLAGITEVRFQVDGQADWQPAAASDKIFDSPSEGFTLLTRPLSVGAHRITVRAKDTQGNFGYAAVTVTVK